MMHFDENVKCRGRKKHFFSAAAYGDEIRRVRKESMPQSALLLIEERKAEDFIRALEIETADVKDALLRFQEVT